MVDDQFQLYDLKVEVVHGDRARPLVCQHRLGDTFFLRGSRIEIAPGSSFGMWAMLAVLPFLPAKQRPTVKGDWMTTDADIACTDPHCGAQFRITRLELKTYRHGDFTKVPLGANS
ncbi:MAG: TIGR04076 family protein [Alphaproteobacteria bacterium]|nr:TIGR04076 family protein [Alphaproteobacteria bacterium]